MEETEPGTIPIKLDPDLDRFRGPVSAAQVELPPGPEDELEVTEAKVTVKAGFVVYCNRCTNPLIAIVSGKAAAMAIKDRHMDLHKGRNKRIMEILSEHQAQRDAAGSAK